MNFKSILYLFIFIMIILIGIYHYKRSLPIASYYSPDGEYKLEIKRRHNYFLSTMPGNGGLSNALVLVILKETNGKTIGKTTDECVTLFDSVEIRWDLDHNEVWYGRGKTIHLKTGKVTC